MSALPGFAAFDGRALAALRVLLGSYFAAQAATLPGASAGWLLLPAVATLLALLALIFGYRGHWSAVVSWGLLVVTGLATATGPVHGVPAGLTGVLLLLAAVPSSRDFSIDAAMGWTDSAAQQQSRTAWLALVVQFLLVAAAAASATQQPLSAADMCLLVAVAALVLLPSRLWDRLAGWARGFHGDALRIYYDRDCAFCLKICLIIRTFLLLGRTPVLPAQSDPAVEKIMLDNNSWVVFDRDGSYQLRWHAVLLLLRRSALTRPLGILLTRAGMGRWGDSLYGAIAASRGRLSRITARLLPLASGVTRRRSPVFLPAIWLAATVAYCWLSLAGLDAPRIHGPAQTVGLVRVPMIALP